jgi:hypothetical protein
MEKLIFLIPQRVDEFTEREEEPTVLPVLYPSKEKAQADFLALLTARIAKAKALQEKTAPVNAALFELSQVRKFTSDEARVLHAQIAEMSAPYWQTNSFIFGNQYFSYSRFIDDYDPSSFMLPAVQTLDEYFTSGLLTPRAFDDLKKRGLSVYPESCS